MRQLAYLGIVVIAFSACAKQSAKSSKSKKSTDDFADNGGSSGSAGRSGSTNTGGMTTSTCAGVTDQGECRNQSGRSVAVTCDLHTGQVKTTDCSPGHCERDASRGIAHCVQGSGFSGGTTGSGQCLGVTDVGECRSVGGRWAVVKCDLSTNSLRTTDCSAQNMVCRVDFNGTPRCVNDSGSTGGGGNGTVCSNGLTYAGLCDGNILKYCDNGTPTSIDCTAGDQPATCSNSCDTGADCCGPPPGGSSGGAGSSGGPGGDCGGIGWYGDCLAGNIEVWCDSSGVKHTNPCGDFATCQKDACGPGAICCPNSGTSSGGGGTGGTTCDYDHADTGWCDIDGVTLYFSCSTGGSGTKVCPTKCDDSGTQTICN